MIYYNRLVKEVPSTYGYSYSRGIDTTNLYLRGNPFSLTDIAQSTYPFSQPIGGWDVSSYFSLGHLFLEAKAFNQPIGDWGISNSNWFTQMFYGASSFNQDLSSWDVTHGVTTGMFMDCPIEEKFKPRGLT